jgi:threonine aldolase
MVFDMSSTHSADLHPDFQPGGAIDLRSDTVTLPGDEMRRAMLSAELGDDVIDIDPTVQRLQHVIAERVGQEAAIFMPSGTMTNQVALRLHCQPGDEFLCEQRCHSISSRGLSRN